MNSVSSQINCPKKMKIGIIRKAIKREKVMVYGEKKNPKVHCGIILIGSLKADTNAQGGCCTLH